MYIGMGKINNETLPSPHSAFFLCLFISSIQRAPNSLSSLSLALAHQMKILCDVCSEGEASYYCAADEASLCAACDHRVHHANKLAGKHQRFSLLPPSPKQAPLCDICQEKKAFLFCQQDRAILCRDCDVSVHKANQLTQKHTRFLLTGVRISANPTLYSESTAESSFSNLKDTATATKNKGGGAPTCTTPPAKCTTPMPSDKSFSNLQFSTSSISEYLIEMLPGWHVEDLLDSSSPSPSPFCKNGENDLVLPFWDADLHGSSVSGSGFPIENMGFWVPRVQNQSFQSFQDNINNNCTNLAFGIANGCRDQFKESCTNSIKSTRKRSDDNSFAVPQITPPSASAAVIKRSRNSR